MVRMIDARWRAIDIDAPIGRAASLATPISPRHAAVSRRPSINIIILAILLAITY